MIPKKKKEYVPEPMEHCTYYNSCSANMCPLDPDIVERQYVPGEDKCKASKVSRLKIAEEFLELLPRKGFTRREWAGLKNWDRRTPREKKRFSEQGRKILKTLKKGL